MAAEDTFSYLGMDVDGAEGTLACHYGLGLYSFTERISLGEGLEWGPVAREAARLVYLLAGVSYYKAAPAPVLDLGNTPVRDAEIDFLRTFYVEGLGEYAYRNQLDLGALRVEGGVRIAGGGSGAGAGGGSGAGADPPSPSRPLIPFGGGLDSIVTVESIRHRVDDAALFVLSRPGDRFAAIEACAAVSGLPVVRAGRELDGQILRSAELGWRNGHVPITGILSAIAVLSAALHGRDAVVMSNEWSASVGNVRVDDRWVNHQWSKSLEFEERFAAVVGVALDASVGYFSALRPHTELWIAERFAALERYHPVFRSCNRAFAVEPSRRMDEWCGVCDKCCFVDLVLAPFLPAERLRAIFSGREPLDDLGLAERFRTLVALSPDIKPWECVGDTDESRAALVLAAARPDRAATPLLHTLVAELGAGAAAARALVPALLRPAGAHHVPADLVLAAS
ncbi:MAG TPA: hypothetical protein VG184_12210 [Acidimicrobiales bacterium]|nr:hypothetical protein [Acidimicrobiales bacterium]